ncbi:type I polyketide synthase [Micromonospora sp. NPDC048935]|uniref:type I polyketide synthase n=1 Tax=Micromonospora sp. NPDC048935 TaxID=3364262 RepID=UPI00370F8D16
MTSSPGADDLPVPETAIAIVGMAGRFPGASSVAQLWRNLCDGVESVTFFTPEQLAAAAVPEQEYTDPAYVPARAIVEGVELFDAEFFGYSVRDAEILDPQQRLFLECAWHALEDAGYDPERYDGQIGVFGGSAISMYLLGLLAHPELVRTVGGYRLLLANDKDHLTTRVAHKLNLRGPAVTVQTACSTSLVAVHLAVDSLLSRQCDLALAGGVALSLPQLAGYRFEEQGIMSPDGHCRPLDAAAAGTVPGNGAGIVVLKRLADALADGDTVHALLLGSAVNNDGSRKAGYTAPSAQGQAEVVAEAVDAAGVSPHSIGYVEAHGTGTALGDPIEVAALAEALGRDGTSASCMIGSVKSNIGHLDVAAGVVGVIKTALALRHGVLPPTLHFRAPNPRSRLSEAGFVVNAAVRDWPAGDGPRRAGVSSFGMGGTNAHVILQEPPAPPPPAPGRTRHVLTLSATTPAALTELGAALARHLSEEPEAPLADVAYTTQVGRRVHRYRRAVSGADATELCAALKARPATGDGTVGGREVTFLFPGQGSQRRGMAAVLYRDEPVFRAAVDRCLRLVPATLGCALRAALLDDPDAPDLRDTALAQPALFVVEFALTELWAAWGVRPAAMIGHSVGEYVAACVAGVFSLEDALAVVIARGRLVSGMPDAAMLSTGCSEDELAELIDGIGRPGVAAELSVAAINGPRLTVLSGTTSAITAVAEQAAARGVPARRLFVSHAFHSWLLDPVLATFEAVVAGVRRNAPRIPYLSNVTGRWITADEATSPQYWAAHLRGTVRFADGVRNLLADGPRVLLEVGPGSGLAGPAVPPGADRPVLISTLPATGPDGLSGAAVPDAAGGLWAAGVDIDWSAYHDGSGRRRVPLPGYPFQRRRLWIDGGPGLGGHRAVDSEAPAQAPAGPDGDPAVTEVERVLLGLWTEMLGAQPIGLHDEFLALGGHSLLATQLTTRIRDAFDVPLTVERLFELRTVARIGDHIEELLLARLAALDDDEVERLVSGEAP